MTIRIDAEGDTYTVLDDSDAINELMRERRAETVMGCRVCGDAFTAEEWAALPKLAAMDGWPVMRNCGCGATLVWEGEQ